MKVGFILNIFSNLIFRRPEIRRIHQTSAGRVSRLLRQYRLLSPVEGEGNAKSKRSSRHGAACPVENANCRVDVEKDTGLCL